MVPVWVAVSPDHTHMVAGAPVGSRYWCSRSEGDRWSREEFAQLRKRVGKLRVGYRHQSSAWPHGQRRRQVFEKYMILTRGFKNVHQDGNIVAFQLQVRITYYRGIPLSCVEGFDVTVDGETFTPANIRYSIAGRTFTAAEAAQAGTVRWAFGDPLTLLVSKPGGLKPGMHDVKVVETLRISYMPNSRSVATSRKKMVLVQ